MAATPPRSADYGADARPVAVVTGANRGIGPDVTRQLAGHGRKARGGGGGQRDVGRALLPDDGPTGGFYRDGQPLPW